MKYRRSIHDAAVLVLLAGLLVAVVAVGAFGPKFRLKEIAPESVPAEVREGAPGSPDATNVVWRDFHEEPGYYVAVVTYDRNTPVESGRGVGSTYAVGFYTLDAAGKLTYEGGCGSGLGPWVFQGGGGWGSGGGSAAPLPAVYDIQAHGVAFHPRATRVVGTTDAGRVVECRVVNGFWGLYLPGVPRDEWWISVDAVDADGRVLFRYWDGEHWQLG